MFGTSSIMGGKFWVDHGNGRFSGHGNISRGGFSWLDLYAMGLADAEEVPDMFIVRNLQSDRDPNKVGLYTGEKEIISIDQIVATPGLPVPWGPGGPGTAHSQKVFNVGFVYLLEPGQTPSGDMLALHARYKEQGPGTLGPHHRRTVPDHHCGPAHRRQPAPQSRRKDRGAARWCWRREGRRSKWTWSEAISAIPTGIP